MTTNEQPSLSVHSITGLGLRGGRTEWSVECEDAHGKTYIMSFEGWDSMDDADDFAHAIRSTLAVNERIADLGRTPPMLLMLSEYVEASDTYNVRFGSQRIPLSIVSFEPTN